MLGSSQRKGGPSIRPEMGIAGELIYTIRRIVCKPSIYHLYISSTPVILQVRGHRLGFNSPHLAWCTPHLPFANWVQPYRHSLNSVNFCIFTIHRPFHAGRFDAKFPKQAKQSHMSEIRTRCLRRCMVYYYTINTMI